MKNEKSKTSIKRNLWRLLSAVHASENDVTGESRTVTVTRARAHLQIRERSRMLFITAA